MEFTGKNVLVVGTRKSGVAAFELLKKKQAKLIVFEGNKDAKIEEIRNKSNAFADAKIIIGELPVEIKETLDLVVLSPGVPTDLPWIHELRDRGILIIGEIELAYQCAKGDVLAITGTNGKTTTTALLGEIMQHVREDVKVVGNIGIPYTSVADETGEETVTVAEISSFQLETAVEFKPKVTAILNITPDHLNRHHTMENYIAVKESITKNQDRDGVCVLNYEDSVLREFGKTLKCRVVYFSSRQKLQDGFYLDGEEILFAKEGKTTLICNVNELNLLGRHNYENVMAATAMAYYYGVSFDQIKEVLVKFKAVEHRIEYVTEKRGVKFYNDSKGTNPDAAIQGIRAMNRPTFLIGGGYDKQSEYDDWIEAFDGKVKKLVLIGATKEKIADTARKHGFFEIVFADTLEEAIHICYENAVSGDVVLLSPACASWDMFESYEQRGEIFKEIVTGLKE